MITVMWEVVAAEDRADDLAAWVTCEGWARLCAEPGFGDGRAYASADDGTRVVVVSTWSSGDPAGSVAAVTRALTAPAGLVARAPHAWAFTEVAAGRPC